MEAGLVAREWQFPDFAVVPQNHFLTISGQVLESNPPPKVRVVTAFAAHLLRESMRAVDGLRAFAMLADAVLGMKRNPIHAHILKPRPCRCGSVLRQATLSVATCETDRISVGVTT
jgi:hypothetical protein